MNKVDALQMVHHVRKRLLDLAVSENYVRDNVLSDVARTIWSGPGENGGLVSELWVEGAFPGERSKDSLESLCDQSLFPVDLCKHIHKQGVFSKTLKLYNHQSEAIRLTAEAVTDEKPAVVITAGTGLGKTEAFLLPMLMDLWTAPDRQKDGGMRCLVLYPMNALVADQVERIYHWLQGQKRLSVFHFTSETPENYREANRCGEPLWEPCRMRTREEARGFETHDGKKIEHEPFGSVPDIVITNYSMLEYMLCRPQDSRFFGPDLRCIILDEAHLYSGTLAAEIMMLLRRVRERCCVASTKILHMATSATLGGNDKELCSFTSSLFSTPETNTVLIRGRQAKSVFNGNVAPPSNPPATKNLAAYADIDFATITTEDQLVENDKDTVERLFKATSQLVSKDEAEKAYRDFIDTPARFLFACLHKAPLIRRIAKILNEEKGNVISLEDLAGRLFNVGVGADERNATIALLRLSAAARNNVSELPMIPHRLHFLVRAPEGLALCLNQQCSGPEDHRIHPVGCLQPVGDRCKYCNHILLPVHRCDNCGEWALAAHENQELSTLEPGYYAKHAEQRTFYLLTRPAAADLEEVNVNSLEGEILGYGSEGIHLWKAPRESSESLHQVCPTCKTKWTPTLSEELQPEWRRSCRSLIGGRPFALSVTAETVLYNLPQYREPSCNWKPARGRRLLCFSDSRASAARLGPLLTQQHEMQVVRAAITHCVQELIHGEATAYLTNEVKRLEKELLSNKITPGLRIRLESELKNKKSELERSKEGTNFRDFARLFAERDELVEILDRESSDRQYANKYGQTDWKKNRSAIQDQAEGLIAKELERPLKKRTSVESVGLIEVVYPGVENLQVPLNIEAKLPIIARRKIGDVWPQVLILLLDSIRADGCIDWSNESSSRKWLGESPLSGRWATRKNRGWASNVFCGATLKQLRRNFIYKVLTTAGCNEDESDALSSEVLLSAFDQLYDLAGNHYGGLSWLKKEKDHQTALEEADKAIQIVLDELSIRTPSQLYRCETTGTLWTQAALNWAPIEGCLGLLRPITLGQADSDARWGRARREFRKSPIFSMGLWAEEHSAQRSPLENKRLQDLFKNGIRNILSSTTTMELGIDIGGLNGVLLGNVPPSSANHRQRAGRAGRRTDGSAVVVTYSRDTEYEREVFRRFDEFLGRDLRKPNIFKDRRRIIERHLNAVLLSEFLRYQQPSKTGAMHAFGRMGQFCGVGIPPRWNRDLQSKPTCPPDDENIANQFVEHLRQLQEDDLGLRGRIALLSQETILCNIQENAGWGEYLNSAGNIFSKAIKEWTLDIEELKEAWNDVPPQPLRDKDRERARANQIRYMIKALCDITVIEWLADRRFLPRYGFPINLQSLSVRKAVDESRSEYSIPDERYRLERSSLLALNEYVPESHVLVGGRVAVSRGLRKHWTDSNLDEALGLQYYSLECSEQHVYIYQSQNEVCPSCGGNPIKKQQLVFPRFGFTTAAWEEMSLGNNPERVGKQSVYPVSFTEHGEEKVEEEFAGIKKARITYKEDAELIVRNEGKNSCGYAICTKCGFAMSERTYGDGRVGLPQDFEAHASIFSSNPKSFCWEKGDQAPPILRNRVLAARELTDMLLLEWPEATIFNRDAVYSFGRALMLAGARLLNLDDRELGMVLLPRHNENLGIVMYDTSPGGAGHCRELINLGREWIETSRKILYVNDEHHKTCVRACLDCILDFSGQYSANMLNRLSALNLLEEAID